MSATYGCRLVIAISVISTGCYNRHVNGTTLPPDKTCTGNWTAVVTNNTDRVYDLYIGDRPVGTADPHSTTRTVIEPRFGQITPSLRESATTREQKGARIAQGALRMVCE